jgi:hypothetical protein
MIVRAPLPEAESFAVSKFRREFAFEQISQILIICCKGERCKSLLHKMLAEEVLENVCEVGVVGVAAAYCFYVCPTSSAGAAGIPNFLKTSLYCEMKTAQQQHHGVVVT